MPASAPDVTTTAIRKQVSSRLIDSTGDKASDIIEVPVAATAAQIEAFKDAYGAITSADLYEVEVPSRWSTVPDKDNADVAERDEVSNVLNVLIKKATGESDTIPIRAPVPGLFVAGTDDIDPANADFATFLGALLAMKGAGWTVVSARYTGRKQTNKAIAI